MAEITICLEGITYEIPKNKIKSLKQWLNENCITESTEELIIDLETTKGLEIEFDETKEKKEEDSK